MTRERERERERGRVLSFASSRVIHPPISNDTFTQTHIRTHINTDISIRTIIIVKKSLKDSRKYYTKNNIHAPTQSRILSFFLSLRVRMYVVAVADDLRERKEKEDRVERTRCA